MFRTRIFEVICTLFLIVTLLPITTQSVYPATLNESRVVISNNLSLNRLRIINCDKVLGACQSQVTRVTLVGIEIPPDAEMVLRNLGQYPKPDIKGNRAWYNTFQSGIKYFTADFRGLTCDSYYDVDVYEGSTRIATYRSVFYFECDTAGAS